MVNYVVDAIARKEALERFVLPDELHIPVAVKSKDDLEKYIGTIIKEVSKPNSDKAFIVQREFDPNFSMHLPIWDQPGSDFFHAEIQLWVDVDYSSYRKAFHTAFPEMDIKGKVIDHIMNRRHARYKEYKYIRLVAIDRATNTGSGATTEKWGIDVNKKEKAMEKYVDKNQKVQLTDICGLAKMMNINPGGGYMETIRLMQDWID